MGGIAGPDKNIWTCRYGSYCKISTDDGSRTDFEVPSLKALDMCVGPDNNLWLSGPKYVWKVS